MLSLRVQGYDVDQIATKLGIRASVVQKDLNVILSAAGRESSAKDDMRVMQKMQLDYLWASLQTAVELGNVQAINTALKVLERQAKLFALDKDPKATVTLLAGPRDWDAILSDETPGVALGFDEPS